MYQFTVDELFEVLGDDEFLEKLFMASDKRVHHHYEWTKNLNTNIKSKQYQKVKKFIELRSSVLKLIKSS